MATYNGKSPESVEKLNKTFTKKSSEEDFFGFNDEGNDTMVPSFNKPTSKGTRSKHGSTTSSTERKLYELKVTKAQEELNLELKKWSLQEAEDKRKFAAANKKAEIEAKFKQQLLNIEQERIETDSQATRSLSSFKTHSFIKKWKNGLIDEDIYRTHGEIVFTDKVKVTEESDQIVIDNKLEPSQEVKSNLDFKRHNEVKDSKFNKKKEVSPQFHGNNSRVKTKSEVHSDYVFRNEDDCPKASHFLARQSFSKDLPVFDGNSLDWPMFVSYYKQSTEACKFSNAENLCRLMKCLKGEAKESVVALLIHPDNVQEVIETLEFLFGRPEKIIHQMIEKAKQIKAPRENQLESLLSYATAVRNLSSMLRSFNKRSHIYNPQLLQELLNKLPSSLQLEWGRLVLSQHEELTILNFSDWLFEIAKAASLVVVPAANKVLDRQFKPKKFVLTHIEKEDENDKVYQPKCPYCQDVHRIDDCQQFQRLNSDDRWENVSKMHLCYSCLKDSHILPKCKSKRRCKVNGCLRIHHPLLHKLEEEVELRRDDKEQQPLIEPEINCHTTHKDKSEKVLFKIIPVKLYGPKGELDTYAFLDDGSSTTLLEASIAQELGLKGTPSPLCLKWTGKTTKTEESSQEVAVQISGKNRSDKYLMVGVRTVQSLDLPIQTIKIDEMSKKLPHLKELLIDDLDEAVPRILIGMNQWKLGFPLEIMDSADNNLCATKTRLGWLIFGTNVESQPPPQEVHHSFHICHCESSGEDLHEMTKKFFSTEDFGVRISKEPLESLDDVRSLEIMESTTKNIGNRYETGLLWKFDNVKLPESKKMAERRLRCLEQKMDKYPEFSKAYCKKIDEYVEKGYARKLTKTEEISDDPKKWYLPHFGVENPNKPGKLRLVFDAASKSNGISLNDMLLKGPDRYNLLLGVLYKFREGTTAICGDIQEMFHQILIRDEDLAAQRFLWRGKDRETSPDTYVMKAMIFGAICSPSQAQEIKNRNALENGQEYPVASEAIINRHYVDDYLDSFNSEEEAYQALKQVSEVHARGGFRITNWITNSQYIVNKLQSTNTFVKNMNLDDEDCNERVLGMFWCTSTDELHFKLQFHRIEDELLSGSRIPTKREVLKILMSVYDPIGFLANFVVYMKNIIQEVWSTGIGWDDELPSSIYEKWQIWINELPKVRELRIPRCYSPIMERSKIIDLHIFVDASESAFAAVGYFRITSVFDEVDVSFVGGKTRVAPQKQLSIPRLELQAAVMGSRLASTIQKEHAISINKVQFWSDSRTVLCWLRSDSRKYKPFVGHRISEVLESTDAHQWRWVPTKLNVADDATKWSKIPQFDVKGRWLNGPEFLYLDEEQWPAEVIHGEELSLEEIKSKFIGLSIRIQPDVPLPDANNIETYNHLVRVTAWIMRYISNLYLKTKDQLINTGELEAKEIRQSEESVIRRCQFESYKEEITNLVIGKPSRSSSLIKLSPYLDDKGILRARGRIDEAPVETSMKRPIILEKSHPVTKLIISKYHIRYCHQGMNTIINEIRQVFWIPQLRSAVKASKMNCQVCKNRDAKPQIPEMGSLPAARVTPHVRPFTFTGVDLFGPMEVTVGRRHEKRWGVLFTCMTVRAIHIEIVHSLSTDSYIMSFRNFIARRGVPSEIYSDNGTNFKGAEKELAEAVSKLDKNAMMAEYSSKNVDWKFNPPAAPHMGGAWERLVQSVKKVLKTLLFSKFPKDEVLRNFLMEAERVINCRPLVHEPVDINSEEMLTPNHFLIGSSSGDILERIPEAELSLSRQWKSAQVMANHFWTRWIREYLPTLIRREKWHEKVEPVKIGDCVLIVDEQVSRNIWRKGLVIKVYPGKDGIVRVADVKTSTGILKRPVAKLVVLDVLQVNDAIKV